MFPNTLALAKTEENNDGFPHLGAGEHEKHHKRLILRTLALANTIQSKALDVSLPFGAGEHETKKGNEAYRVLWRKRRRAMPQTIDTPYFGGSEHETKEQLNGSLMVGAGEH